MRKTHSNKKVLEGQPDGTSLMVRKRLACETKRLEALADSLPSTERRFYVHRLVPARMGHAYQGEYRPMNLRIVAANSADALRIADEAVHARKVAAGWDV